MHGNEPAAALILMAQAYKRASGYEYTQGNDEMAAHYRKTGLRLEEFSKTLPDLPGPVKRGG